MQSPGAGYGETEGGDAVFGADELEGSSDEVDKTDAILGVNAGALVQDDGSVEAGTAEDADDLRDDRVRPDGDAGLDARDTEQMSDRDTVNIDGYPADLGGADSSDTDSSDTDPPETDADTDVADGSAVIESDDLDPSPLASDAEELFRLANDVATNDAVAGETVLPGGGAREGSPEAARNELTGDEVDLGETAP